ncbi:MAG: molecular chaperone DnaK, partial [Bacteroidetes bacterium]|nr:molecular chaperone DnaK [Bacteroidota bacterium]
EAIKSNNSSDIKTKMDELNKIWSEASTQMYEAAKTNPQQPEEPKTEKSEKKDDKKVENADFEVIDDK